MDKQIYDELLFQDWIAQKEWEDPDWIIVSRFTSGNDMFWTHSVLLYLDRIGDIQGGVPDKLKNKIKTLILKRLFTDHYLDNQLLGDFGIPDIGLEDYLHFNDEYIDERELKYRPLIYTYSYNGDRRDTNDPLEIYLSSDFVTAYRLKRMSNGFSRIDRMEMKLKWSKLRIIMEIL